MTWLRLLMAALLATASLLAALPAQAATGCSASVTALDFNSANPADGTTTATISYECNTYAFLTRVAVSMCFAIDAGSALGSTIAARRMTNSYGDPLGFQMFKDPARTQVWGDSSASPGYLEIQLDYWAFLYERRAGSIEIYGKLSDISQAAAGSYSNMLSNARLIYSYREGTNPNPPKCNQGNDGSIVSIPFEARVDVRPSCSVITASNMSFNPGGMPLSGTRTGNLVSTSTIDLTCTRRTSWQVGLDDGLHATPAGVRQMCNADGACIAYQLYKPDGASPWGDDIDVDTMEGSSAGTSQSLTVHGRVDDQPLAQAGRYSDTVKVTLTY